MIAPVGSEGVLGSNNLGTRNAVETAIELSKLDRKSTWEGMAIRLRPRIKPWESLLRPEKSEASRS